MGQAKRRGSFEQRLALALEHKRQNIITEAKLEMIHAKDDAGIQAAQRKLVLNSPQLVAVIAALMCPPVK